MCKVTEMEKHSSIKVWEEPAVKDQEMCVTFYVQMHPCVYKIGAQRPTMVYDSLSICVRQKSLMTRGACCFN